MKRSIKIITGLVFGIAVSYVDYAFLPFFNLVFRPLYLPLIWLMKLFPVGGAMFIAFRLAIVMVVMGAVLLVFAHITAVRKRSKVLWLLLVIDLAVIGSYPLSNWFSQSLTYCDAMPSYEMRHNCLVSKMRNTNDPQYCEMFQDRQNGDMAEYMRNVCYREIAVATRDFTLCDRLHLLNDTTENDQCYHEAARFTHDKTYCDKISAAYRKAECLGTKNSVSPRTAAPASSPDTDGDGQANLATPLVKTPVAATAAVLSKTADCEIYANDTNIAGCYGYLARINKDKGFCGKIAATDQKAICYREYYKFFPDTECGKEPGVTAQDNCWFGRGVGAARESDCRNIMAASLKAECIDQAGRIAGMFRQECGDIEKSQDMTDCNTLKAIFNQNSDYCDQITTEASRAMCYSELAKMTFSPDFCDRTGIDNDSCYMYLTVNFGYGSEAELCGRIRDAVKKESCQKRFQRIIGRVE